MKENKSHLKPDTLLHWYFDMNFARYLEQGIMRFYEAKKIRGYCHLYIGQEAVAVGSFATLQDQDSVITAYRCHVHAALLSKDPLGVIAELLGKERGLSKGRGGSMHLFSSKNNFFGGHGIVGADISIGTGLAFAHKYKKDSGVSLIYFGDGSTAQGQFYESINMAALWKLPAVYIIENNKYGLGTSVDRALANPKDLSQRGATFGIPGKVVDGMNVIEVYDEVLKASEYARKSGPIILEMKTYRYQGHSMSDPATYRTRQEVQDMRKNHDPIMNLRNYLVGQQVNESMITMMQNKAKKEVEDIVKQCDDLQDPDPASLYDNVYSDSKINGSDYGYTN